MNNQIMNYEFHRFIHKTTNYCINVDENNQRDHKYEFENSTLKSN
jgi:hypothetical protein